MPLIILLTLLVIGLLFMLRKLGIENQELKQKLAENTTFLKQLQTKDSLTQVMSSSEFMAALEQEFQRAKRSRRYLSLIACDVDYFHGYRESHGQFAADESLYAIAQAIDGSVKRAGECVGRIGWEKFWVLLPNVPEKKAIALADIIQTAIHKLNIVYENSPISPQVTVSMGLVSFVPTSEEELGVWIRSVEMAVETAKESGGDRCYVAE